MKQADELHSLGLRFFYDLNQSSCQYWLLDQTLLPFEEKWLEIKSTEQLIEAIQSLRVRGAPLIGVSAALGLAQSALLGADYNSLSTKAEALNQARPTAVNLMNCMGILKNILKQQEPHGSLDDLKIKIAKQAIALFHEDVELCQQMGKNGAGEIQDGDTILTHCNTGGLATVGIGTALGVLRSAFEQGKNIQVFVDETRPLLQGGRLTSWELQKLGIPMTLISDNMAAHFMKTGRIQKAIVGSDRIAANGDFANKIGTYSVAVNCAYHQIPFYVAAPMTTVDSYCPHGDAIPIEQRTPSEVLGVKGSFGEVQWAPQGTKVENPSFDVTPAHLVAGWIMDKGLYRQADVKNGVFKNVLHERSTK